VPPCTIGKISVVAAAVAAGRAEIAIVAMLIRSEERRVGKECE
jgi:hypothetical protein